MMVCTSPPELNDQQLLAYLDNEADDAVASHLATCSYCRGKAERLARLLNHFTAQLYRLTCPSPTELGEYQLKILRTDQMDAISQHLNECPHCTKEIAQLQAYLDELAPDVEFNFIERTKVLIARLVSEMPGAGSIEASNLTPAFNVRGDREEHYLYEVDNVQISLEIYDDKQHPGHRTLLGIITGLEAQSLEIQLWQEEKLIVSTEVDDLSTFHILNIPPSTYNLIVTGPEAEIHIQELII